MLFFVPREKISVSPLLPLYLLIIVRHQFLSVILPCNTSNYCKLLLEAYCSSVDVHQLHKTPHQLCFCTETKIMESAKAGADVGQPLSSKATALGPKLNIIMYRGRNWALVRRATFRPIVNREACDFPAPTPPQPHALNTARPSLFILAVNSSPSVQSASSSD